MKKSEFKKIIKPIVSECIKESLMEDGLISGIIAEVVKGMSASQPLRETHQPEIASTTERMKQNAFSKEQTGKLREYKSKLMSAIGQEAYNGINLFEGTTPAPAQGAVNAPAPLAGHEPSDPGVDIKGLFGSVGRNWNAHMNEIKDRK